MTTISSSAAMWGSLWSHAPRDWAAGEVQQAPVYEAVLDRIHVSGRRVLDVGCGAGTFLRLCADRGAHVTGLDAAAGMLEVAGERVPEAELVLGDLQALPFPDGSFDVVTGFTSFFFADDIVVALAEAKRVARPGSPVAIEVFGRPEHCALEVVKAAVGPFRPDAAGGDEPEEPYWRPGVVEELVPQAGLQFDVAFDTTTAFEFADDAELLAVMCSAGGAGAMAGPERLGELHAALLEALARFRRPDGSYRLENEWHTVIACA
jgi:SAM-dependent methyltransferase